MYLINRIQTGRYKEAVANNTNNTNKAILFREKPAKFRDI
jgi:hypothetical protein